MYQSSVAIAEIIYNITGIRVRMDLFLFFEND